MIDKEKSDIRECRDCGRLRHKSLFTKNHTFKDGIDTICLECNHRRVKEWRARGNRKSRDEARKYREHSDKYLQTAADYRARKKLSTPDWLTKDDRFLIAEAFELARRRTKETGIRWHTDHIVPLKANNACGLNVPWNVRVIPALVNWRKANKIIEV